MTPFGRVRGVPKLSLPIRGSRKPFDSAVPEGDKGNAFGTARAEARPERRSAGSLPLELEDWSVSTSRRPDRLGQGAAERGTAEQK